MGPSGGQPPPVLHGGGGAKVSESYEEMWNQFTLLDLVVGLARKMQQESPGIAGRGFEFWVDRADRREWHQVKYQHGREGKWNLGALDTRGVLAAFREKLRGEVDAACVFVSAHSATPLDLLCARAGRAETLERFLDEFVGEGELGRDFKELWERRWGVAEEQAWQWLKRRVFVRSQDWVTLEDRLRERIRTSVDGEEAVVRQVLSECLEAYLYNEIGRDALVAFLTDRGCPPLDWSTRGAGLKERVADVSRDFVDVGNHNMIGATFFRETRPRSSSRLSIAATRRQASSWLGRKDAARVPLSPGSLKDSLGPDEPFSPSTCRASHARAIPSPSDRGLGFHEPRRRRLRSSLVIAPPFWFSTPLTP